MNLTLVAFLYTFHHFATAIESNHVPKVHAVYIYWLLQTFANILHRKKKKVSSKQSKKTSSSTKLSCSFATSINITTFALQAVKVPKRQRNKSPSAWSHFCLPEVLLHRAEKPWPCLGRGMQYKEKHKEDRKGRASANSLDIPGDTG